MTFCTIEEAWGDSFFSMSNKETTVPEYFDEPDIKKVDKKETFSRNYNRVKKRTGSKSRLPKNIRYDLDNDIDGVEGEEEVTIDTESDTIEEEGDIEEAFKNGDIRDIMNENVKLKNLLKKLTNKTQGVDSIFDLCIFLTTGIFVIFLLDTISKLVKSF